MSGAGGPMIQDAAYLEGRDWQRGPNGEMIPNGQDLYNEYSKKIFGMPNDPQFGFQPMPQPHVLPPSGPGSYGYEFPDPIDPGFGGGKGGQIDQPIGIDPAPIQGPGSGSNGPGLDHLKDYGPVVDQMKQYVQSMSGLIDQINSKF